MEIVRTPPLKGGNKFHVGNRAPLTPSPLIKLPIGAIRPEGWLRGQLQLMADGMTGHLQEISPWCKIEGNAWVGPTGEGHSGWEELPYWLKGFVDLGYVLGDQRIIGDANRWIEGILATQRPDGYFGPKRNLDNMDLWPNMPALDALRSFYEATGDARVLPFMSRYFRWQMSVPLEKLLPDVWQHWRGGDNLDSIHWLYNRTGEKWLLDAARVIHERTADWTGRIPTWHGVNLCQGFREPGQYFQQTGDLRYLKAAERNYDTIKGQYGQVPGGMLGADENCRPGYTGPRQAAETCAIVEMMRSEEMLLAITGDVKWADRCEEVAFNSFPASMTPDLKGLHYLTAPNQPQLDHENKCPGIQNCGDMFSYSAYEQYRCCQHNVAMGWPYFAEHLWMATQENGLAAVFYAACEVKARVGAGTTVRIVESTDYPFSEKVVFTISTPKPVRFPLMLRIPGWCDSLKISVNGRTQGVPKAAKGWAVLNRAWKDGDRIALELPMSVRARVWERNRNTVSIDRGPLTYSLKIGEKWERYGGTDKWPGYEVFPTTPWNYGLIVDPKNPDKSLKFVKKPGPLASQPFMPENAPIELRARGKKISEWKLDANGLIEEVQKSPVRSDQPIEEITLIPMGCARLRISAFPQIGEGPKATVWTEQKTTAAASHVWDTLAALNDDIIPTSSSDTTVPRFTWWDHRGTKEWVQYNFSKPEHVSRVEVYWFDDEPVGSCRIPASWRVLWLDGGQWKPVPGATDYYVKKDDWCRVDFTTVLTSAIRLEVQLRRGFSAGILEWRVIE